VYFLTNITILNICFICCDFELVLLHIHGSSGRGPDETICLAEDDPATASGDRLIRSQGTGSMMAAFENGACGYIPTGSTTVAIAAFLLLRAGGIFVPPSSLQMINYPPSTPESTPQGKSNKIILGEMKMSESTLTVDFSAKS
jgi:DNA-binding NarL/FixJ family response regulator